MSRRLFGTDGIRAVAGQEPLTPKTVERIAAASGRVLRAKGGASSKILTGKDTRESCGWIEDALMKGFAASGLEVHSAGVIPTSAVSALLREGGFLAGAVISASHNPSEFNGIKLFSSDGRKIPDDWEREIETTVGADSVRAGLKPAPTVMAHAFKDAADRYKKFLLGTLPPDFSLKGLNWVLDCANGSASKVAPEIFRSLGAKVHALHDSPDGRNINDGCGALHPKSLSAKILETGADGGCAFDGDADRVLFADEKGRVMDGDVLIALAAKHLKETGELEKNTVVATVMANLGFHKEMEKAGITVLTVPVGDKAVSDALETSGAVLGGEQSGHIIFKTHLPTGDGILTALQLLSLARESGKKFSVFTEMLPKYPQVLLNMKVREKVPIEQCPGLAKAIRESEARLKGSGRVLVRYSGTEPLLRIMVEADTDERTRTIAHAIEAAAQKDLL
ncbi:MAG: phosphoglucosamine mutase [Elusimicrobia bacterium RIFCSPLOWO2_01_FULL_60_11]|nr:MAG: phosphoglucosamine mutase [Elusimicrobia bacterium RIFCSPLOWO2_01_FULL_60_11]